MCPQTACIRIEGSRRGVQEVRDKVEPSSRRADVDTELCSSQRDDRLDLIETLGQRQCSAPGSGKRVSGSVEESGSIGDDWNVPGAHRDGREIGRGAWRRMSLCLHVPLPPSTVSLAPRQEWRGVRYPAPYGFARGVTVPVRPARLPGARIALQRVCSRCRTLQRMKG